MKTPRTPIQGWMTNMTNEEQQKHEAAIETWRREAMSLSPRSYHVDHPRLRVLRVGEIDAICDLARRAPARCVAPGSLIKLAKWLVEDGRGENGSVIDMAEWVLQQSGVSYERAAIDSARRNYKSGLEPQDIDRCRDCRFVLFPDSYGSTCSLLRIEIDDPKESRCQRHEPKPEPRGPSEVDDPDWHQIMTKWLEQRDAGRPCSPEDLAAVVATIVRRKLARGAK